MGAEAGELGVPVPELTAKLVPDEDKLEVRFKGKNLFPGYWRNEEATKKAFDEEGFYKTGDAVRIIDKNDLTKGMRFNGRIAENFKMATGTWVNVGGLRSKLIKIGKGLIVDAVITGHDKLYLGAIIIPELNYCRKLAGLSEGTAVSEVVSNAMVHEALQNLINEVGNQRTGSSTYVKKAIFADFELSLDKGEITDKGSINQRAILRNRPELLDLLYNDISNESIIEYRKKQYA